MALYLGPIKKQGTVTYTVVGSPTITDGVASGFSSDNYVRTSLDSVPSNKIQNYEFGTKFTIGNNQGVQTIIGFYGSSNNMGLLFNYVANKVSFVIGKNTNNQEVRITSTSTFTTGETVIAREYYKGDNVFVLKLSKDNGTTWETLTQTVDVTTLNNFSTNYPFRFGRAMITAYPWPFNGSIDLNKTYIKVNNEAWFGNCLMHPGGRFALSYKI